MESSIIRWCLQGNLEVFGGSTAPREFGWEPRFEAEAEAIFGSLEGADDAMRELSYQLATTPILGSGSFELVGSAGGGRLVRVWGHVDSDSRIWLTSVGPGTELVILTALDGAPGLPASPGESIRRGVE